VAFIYAFEEKKYKEINYANEILLGQLKMVVSWGPKFISFTII